MPDVVADQHRSPPMPTVKGVKVVARNVMLAFFKHGVIDQEELAVTMGQASLRQVISGVVAVVKVLLAALNQAEDHINLLTGTQQLFQIIMVTRQADIRGVRSDIVTGQAEFREHD